MLHLAAICSLLPAVPPGSAVAAPEWLHLIPAGEFRGADGRGPWVLSNPAGVIAASATPLVLDECHSTDLALKDGREAPARGWIVELQARDGAIWGRVDWTPQGRARIEAREYRGVSPVFAYAKQGGQVLQLLRAGLTNAPNLPQLAAINSREGSDMDFLTKLRALHGLPAEADEAAVLAACAAAREGVSRQAMALNSVAEAAGLAAGADAAAVATAVQALRAAGDPKELAGKVVALQSQLDTMRAEQGRERAEALVDGAIRAGKPVSALREHYVARACQDFDGVKKELDALVSINSGGIARPPSAPGGDGADGPDAEERAVIAMLGIDPAKFAEEKKRLGLAVENGKGE